MNDKQLIANFLLGIAKKSTTEFIDDAKVDKEMIEVAKKLGIILPSPDFALFRTVWAEIDKVNLNGVRLPRKAVEEGLDTFLFKQVNFEHKGAYNMCGITLAATIKEDKIETINIFYKSLYPDEFEELKEKIKSGDAAVSFEIYNIDPSTKKSVVKELKDGTKEIIKIIVHGTGLLLVNPPACPKAKIFSLIAKKEIQEAEKIIGKVFSEDLIYAQMAIEESKCVNCGKCSCLKDKEDKIMIKCEKCGKDFESSAEEKICVECAALPKETVVAPVAPEETKPAEVAGAETKPVDAPAEAPKEVVAEVKPEVAQPLEVIEPKIVIKTTSIYSEVRIDTYVDGTPSGTQEVKGYTKTITEYKDGTKDEVETEVEIKKKFDFAEVEEKVNAVKAEKDAEITTLKAEQEKVLGEKDKEITNLKQELGTKDQEIADLKNPKVKEKKEKEMTVGAVEVESKNELKVRAQEINQIIANKGKK